MTCTGYGDNDAITFFVFVFFSINSAPGLSALSILGSVNPNDNWTQI